MTPSIQRQPEIAAPKTRSELDALVAQRNELQQQLRNAEERRSALAVQSSITPAEQRGTVTQRIQGLEARIARLDEVIAGGMANAEIAREGGVPAIPIPPVPPVPEMPPFPE